MNMKNKGKVYGTQTRELTKVQETKLEVAEMRMPLWVCGVMNMNKIRHERIRWTTKVGELAYIRPIYSRKGG